MMKRVVALIIFCVSAFQMALAQVTYSPELLQKAKNGDAEAQFNLGWCYGTGTGIQQDDKEAMKWYKKAAKQDYASAIRNVGLYYMNGGGAIEKDEKEGIKWIKKAIEKGNIHSKVILAGYYLQGNGVPKDTLMFQTLLKEAAEQGDTTAQCNLADAYNGGYVGYTKDDKKSTFWYTKAAELGNPRSQYNVGVAYEQGLSVDQNYREALKWFNPHCSSLRCKS